MLTVTQPWAALLVCGIKDVENRGWRPSGGFGGRLLIHAGTRKSEQDLLTPEQRAAADAAGDHWRSVAAVRGAIIGSVLVVDCRLNHDSIWCVPRQWHWVMDPHHASVLHQPIPARGQLGIWTLS